MKPQASRGGVPLYWKLAGALFVILVLVGVGLLSLTVQTARLYVQEVQQRLSRDVAPQIATRIRPFSDAGLDQDALAELFGDLGVVNPTLEVYVLDPQGRILAFSDMPSEVRLERVDLAPVLRFLADAGREPVQGQDPRQPSRRKFFSAAPVHVEGRLRGYVYTIPGGEVYDSTLMLLSMSYVLRASAWLLAGSLLTAALAGLGVFALLTRRLRRLRNAIESFEDGSLAVRATEGPADEVGSLARAYNRLADQIVQQMQTLRNVDLTRREMVANISHDLRTPVASLQGHLETLLVRQDRFDPDERQRSVELALHSAQRLSRLIGELFELATLDAHDAVVQPEPFSISELAHDVVQKFGPQAQRAGIDLRARASEGLPFVLADIGLIERALDNLLDNALRYTPSGGQVVVALSRMGSGIEVRVQDSGCGIPGDELPRIFERFYRVEKSRAGRGGGTGLGLAITKRILELHGSAIRVDSQQGQGAVFTFQLGLSEPGASGRGLRLAGAGA